MCIGSSACALLIINHVVYNKLINFSLYFLLFFHFTQDQDATQVIPEETDLNNSKITVASQDDANTPQVNGKGSSIAGDRNVTDDAT